MRYRVEKEFRAKILQDLFDEIVFPDGDAAAEQQKIGLETLLDARA